MCEVHNIFGFQRDVADGGMTEYLRIPPSAQGHNIPAAITLEDAAIIEPMACAIHTVNRAEVQLDDAAVATFAAGVTQAGNHVAMIGTNMCWGYINQQVDARHGLISMPHVFNSQKDLYVFGGAITAGASVSWFRDEFCQAEMAAAKLVEHGDAHKILEDNTTRIPAGSDGVMFLPYLMGERSPIWDAKASGAFIGLSLIHTRAHLYRAVLEGVSFALRHNMEAGAKGAQSLDAKLIVVGGAAHSDLWMQIIADVTGYPVYTIEENVEAALGAALLAAVGIGLVDDETAEQGWVTLVARTMPDPTASALYNHAFALYRDLYPALKPIMHRLQGGYAAVI